MDSAHLETWLHCLSTSSVLKNSMDVTSTEILATWLDLPPSYGGMGLKSLARFADKEFLGSIATIAASLISFLPQDGITGSLHPHRRGT